MRILSEKGVDRLVEKELGKNSFSENFRNVRDLLLRKFIWTSDFDERYHDSLLIEFPFLYGSGSGNGATEFSREVDKNNYGLLKPDGVFSAPKPEDNSITRQIFLHGPLNYDPGSDNVGFIVDTPSELGDLRKKLSILNLDDVFNLSQYQFIVSTEGMDIIKVRCYKHKSHNWGRDDIIRAIRVDYVNSLRVAIDKNFIDTHVARHSRTFKMEIDVKELQPEEGELPHTAGYLGKRYPNRFASVPSDLWCDCLDLTISQALQHDKSYIIYGSGVSKDLIVKKLQDRGFTYKPNS